MTERLRGRKLQELRKLYFSRHPLCQCSDKTCPHQKLGEHIRLATILDHITPLYKGGSNNWDNYQGLCQECNDHKSITERGDKPKSKIPLGLDWAI